MTEPETQYQPLVGAPSQQTVTDGPAQGHPTRAYKIAGITLLACVLIAGQAMIAYFLLSQGNDIKSLEQQNNNLQAQLTKGRPASVPMRMHMPINALSDMMEVSADEGTGAKHKLFPRQLSQCQKEQAGLSPVNVPGFRPMCDEHGLYNQQQCFMEQCWCVNKASGEVIPGTTATGAARCSGRMVMAGRSAMLTMPDVAEDN